MDYIITKIKYTRYCEYGATDPSTGDVVCMWRTSSGQLAFIKETKQKVDIVNRSRQPSSLLELLVVLGVTRHDIDILFKIVKKDDQSKGPRQRWGHCIDLSQLYKYDDGCDHA